MEIKNSKYLISNADVNKCPDTDVPEYAFIGRSNVGKSSLINMLTRNKGLAKTSQTPGKTLLINHFCINDGDWNIVDLPQEAKSSGRKSGASSKTTYSNATSSLPFSCCSTYATSRKP